MSKTLKQKINNFLCKYAQGDYTDEYGNVVKKADGSTYKTGKVTGADILWNLIVVPSLIILIIVDLISFLGLVVGNNILTHLGIIISVYWLIDPLLQGLIPLVGVYFGLYIIYQFGVIIHKILTVEVAKCSIAEVPPVRQKCSCGAPLPFENEEIRISIKNEKQYRMSLGKCELCGTPKLYNDEEYSVYIQSYNKPKPKLVKIENPADTDIIGDKI